MTQRSWWYANSTANNSRERRYGRLWNEDRCREDLQTGEVSLASTPFALSCRYDISERQAIRILREVLEKKDNQNGGTTGGDTGISEPGE